MFGWLRCCILPHAPNRRMVKKIRSDQYIGYCYHCGARIRRLKRDRWVRDWKRIFSAAPADEGVEAAEDQF